MGDTEANALLNQFRDDSRYLRAELEKLLTENEQLRVERDKVIREARESMEIQSRMPSENFSSQLAQTEQNLIQERQHAVKGKKNFFKVIIKLFSSDGSINPAAKAKCRASPCRCSSSTSVCNAKRRIPAPTRYSEQADAAASVGHGHEERRNKQTGSSC